MNAEHLGNVPSPEELREMYSLGGEHREFIDTCKQGVKNVLSGTDPRFLMIMGPCSVSQPLDGVYEYADRVAKLQDEVREWLLIVMRVYLEKPRTTVGWKGFISDPYQTGTENRSLGLTEAAQLFHRMSKQVAVADELLYVSPYVQFFDDITAWVAIGARNTEGQQNREAAACLSTAVGLKNPTSGDIKQGLNSVIAAQHQQTLMLGNEIWRSPEGGNPYAHLVLRGGAYDTFGKETFVTNYDEASLWYAHNGLWKLTEEGKIRNPAIVIDASHGNSFDPDTRKKNYLRQPVVVKDTMRLVKEGRAPSSLVAVMLESHLEAGRSDVPEHGRSITDACIDWETSRNMVLDMAHILAGARRSSYSTSL